MKNLFHIVLFSMIATITLNGCDSFVDVDQPVSQLTSAQVFESRSTAESALTDIYSKLRDTGILSGLTVGASSNLGMYADELVYYGSDIEPGLPYANNLLPSSAIVEQVWNESYHQIYCANAVIEGVAGSKVLSVPDRNQFTGEALYIRALVHFYLVNIYGDIPYVVTTNYQENRLAKRTNETLIYANIISDLNYAVELLPAEYVSGERVRANKSVALALLARVYLYQGSWADASNIASAVLNNTEYQLEKELDNVFLKESPETILQFSPKFSGDNANEAQIFNFVDGPPPYVALEESLINSFENDDLRLQKWVMAESDGNDTWFHSYKYKQSENTGESLEYSIVFRLAEQYLIRAEARARQGDLIGAKEDLNKIRIRAGLNGSAAVGAEEILEAILQERRTELFTEFGHRFFDLKRFGKLDEVLSTVKSGWNTTDKLWPVPDVELLANPNLGQQNPGY